MKTIQAPSTREPRENDDRQDIVEAIERASTHLISPLPLEQLAEELLESTLDISTASYCAIGLLDETNELVESIAARGIPTVRSPLRIGDMPPDLIATLRSSWDVAGPIDLGRDPFVSRFLGLPNDVAHWVLPIRTEGHVTGGILLGGPGFSPSPQERSGLGTLSSIASASLDRIWLLKRMGRQVDHLRLIHDLGEVMGRKPKAQDLVGRVNQLLEEERFSVASIAFSLGLAKKHLVGSAPAEADREVWRTRSRVQSEDHLYMPMKVSGKCIGSVRIQPPRLSGDEMALVESLADGLAQLVSRTVLRAEAEEAERESAIVAERGRIASALHETVAQGFLAIGMLAHHGLDQDSSSLDVHDCLEKISDLAREGKWDIDHAVRSLAAFPEARGGIVPALEALRVAFEGDNGQPILFVRTGPSRKLGARVERALYRVACCALTNACHYGGSTAVRMDLVFEQDSITLSVCDDGSGVSGRQLDHRARRCIADMRAASSEVGGSFRLGSRRPRGMELSVTVKEVLK